MTGPPEPDFTREFCRWRSVGVVGTTVLTLLACRAAEPAHALAPRPNAAGHAGADVPDLSAGPPKQATPHTEDRLYREAASGEPIDLQRLAARDGAGRLLDAVQVGGTIGLTALAALPYAEDSELALGDVCGLLPKLPRDQLQPALVAVHAMVARPPEARERLEVEGAERCETVLRELAGAADLRAPLHDLAVSAKAMLAEHRRR